ncbi:MAG: YlxR family protein [Chloroflexi bacterium]|nr:YlxR family protein [Chloroflexota bacterium]
MKSKQNSAVRRKHVPQRTCIACRQVRDKRDLVRVVRTPEGSIEIDERGKRNGRGAYLCRSSTCWALALNRKALEHALEVEITPAQKEMLQEYGRSLPDLESPASFTDASLTEIEDA